MHERRTFYLVVSIVIIGISVAGYFAMAHDTANSQAASYAAALAGCNAYPEGSTETIPETSRLTIYLPKGLYPNQSGLLSFETASGTATAGWVSNAGPAGLSYGATDDCWAYYYDFEGEGQVDLIATSSLPDTPVYRIRFIIEPVPASTTTQ